MKSPDPLRSDARSSQGAPRKVYEKPRLEIYGDLTELTNSQMGSMDQDGAGHPTKHFTS